MRLEENWEAQYDCMADSGCDSMTAWHVGSWHASWKEVVGQLTALSYGLVTCVSGFLGKEVGGKLNCWHWPMEPMAMRSLVTDSGARLRGIGAETDSPRKSRRFLQLAELAVALPAFFLQVWA